MADQRGNQKLARRKFVFASAWMMACEGDEKINVQRMDRGK